MPRAKTCKKVAWHAAVWLRRLVGFAVLLCFAALFSKLEWQYVSRFAPLAKLQLMPALLACNFVVAAAILLVTLLVGRLYCSVLCPLGLMQDAGGFLGRMLRRLAQRWSEQPPIDMGPLPTVSRARFVVRHFVFAALVVGLCSGFGLAGFEPYGIFGRSVYVTALSGSAFALAIFALAAIGHGRAWCGWVCPVGTFLGFFSRISLLRPKIDETACVGCHNCEKRCKARAITIWGYGEGGTIDASLCVDCFDCAAGCPTGAISFGRIVKKDEEDSAPSADGMTRKGFIIGTMSAGATLAADAAVEEKTVDGGFAAVTPPGVDVKLVPLKPAGSKSLANFTTRCVSCQLCVKACPNHVLRPSKRTTDYRQPEMAFDKGFCTVDCTRCAEVCPTGAIAPLDGLKREDVRIGNAVWHRDRCIAATEGVNCTACERHCPVKAITRVKSEGGVMLPAIDAEKCIGCGACEHVCPARPMPGMVVEAYRRHVEVRRALSVALAFCMMALGATAQDTAVAEADDFARAYVGVAGAMTLPQGGAPHMRRLGGAALRGGWYAAEFLAVEGGAAWMENAAGLAVQGLWHWQDADLYGRLFGYSAFDPFFTFGARGWIGDGLGQVGPKAGVGAFWHLTDEWSLRADADATLGLDSGVAMLYSLSLGVQYAF